MHDAAVAGAEGMMMRRRTKSGDGGANGDGEANIDSRFLTFRERRWFHIIAVIAIHCCRRRRCHHAYCSSDKTINRTGNRLLLLQLLVLHRGGSGAGAAADGV